MITVGDFEYNPANILGNGAFAIVYEGRFRKNPDQKVAIKAMRSNDRNLAKSKNLLNKEIAVLRDLNHPNIVRLYDHKIAQEGVYLFMEYCNGGDLAKILSERRTLPEDVISNLLAQLSSALDVMNLQGIMHRDLKPGNILLCFPTDNRFKKPSFDIYKSKIKYKLADFGFARFLQDGIMAATMCGSPMYMAPEVLLCKNYTITVDIWSMGVIIYQCLTGVAPFQANNPEALKAIYQKNLDPVRFPSQASNYLKDVIKKMLIKNPANRISFKDIMQHPFVRGNVTVDPPRRQSNITSERQSTKTKSLAEIFGPPSPVHKDETPQPPPYVTSANTSKPFSNRPIPSHQASPISTLFAPQPTAPLLSNNNNNKSSAIPIPTPNNIPNVSSAPSNNNKRGASNNEDYDPANNGNNNGFVFVNRDGSIGKEDRHMDPATKLLSNLTQNSERSENILERNRLSSESSRGVNIDSGNTSTNTGTYGSSTNQKPFKLSMEGYYSSKTDTASRAATSQSKVSTVASDITSQTPMAGINRSPSNPPRTPSSNTPSGSGFYLSRSPPDVDYSTSPITAAMVKTPQKESLTNILRRNSSQTEIQSSNSTKDKKGSIADINKEYIDKIDDLLEEPPELNDDAICSAEHREESQKIVAVLDMCELLFDLADQRYALLSRHGHNHDEYNDDDDEAADDENTGAGELRDNQQIDQQDNAAVEANSSNPGGAVLSGGGGGGHLLDVISTPQRIAEQMLLYQRILHYLHTLFYEIQSARDKNRLCPTRSSYNNIRACNNLYHRCIIKLDLLIKETERNYNFGNLIMSWYNELSINKLVFHYSLDQCSAAEMDAMVGSFEMCTRRYQAAMLLMHGLRQHAKSDGDIKLTKEVTELMQTRFINHWHAGHESPTVEE